MKILVVSLLRLGDIVTATPVLQGLRRRHPDARIDLVCNAECQSLIPLVPHIDAGIVFDRRTLQECLVDPERSIFEAYDRLRGWIAALNETRYDLVLNLTHNRLSGWLCGLVRAGEYRGLHRSESGDVRFGSPWFSHLNGWGLEPDGNQCHFSELQYRGAGLDQEMPGFTLQETDGGRKEAERLRGAWTGYLLVQPLTSEDKKNWGLERFATCLRTFRSAQPSAPVMILGAPGEKAVLQGLCERVGGADVRLAICSLEGAYSLVRGAALLLTGDTSIKHFASAAGTPTIELSLGSSHFRQSGAFADRSLILQARASCAPCRHSDVCSQATHVCAEAIAPDLVGLLAAHVFSGDVDALRSVAERLSSRASLYQVVRHALGEWEAVPLLHPWPSSDIVELIDRVAWRLWLAQQSGHGARDVASGARMVAEFAGRDASPDDRQRWGRVLTDLEHHIDRLRTQLHEITAWRHLASPASPSAEECKIRLAQLAQMLVGHTPVRSFGRAFLLSLEDVRGSEVEQARGLDVLCGQALARGAIVLALARAVRHGLEDR